MDTRPKRWGPSGMGPAIVLVSANFIDAAEANLIPGVLPLLQDHWGFGDTAAGAIPTAMAIGGLLVTLPAGYVADRYNRTRVLALVVASWSLFSVASGLAFAFWAFFVVRVILGTAAHINNPASSSLITDFYPASSRARVFALHRAAWYLGTSIGVAVAGVLGDAFGWRAPFFVMVAPGLVIAYLVWRLREPERGVFEALPEPAPAETTGTRRGAVLADVRGLLAIPTLRYIFVGVAVAFAGFHGLGYWLPSFWERTYDLSEGTSAALTGALALIGTVSGSWIGGVLGDRWQAERPTGRVELAGGSLLFGGAILVAAILTPVLPLQVPLLLVAAVTLVSGMPSYAAAIADVLPVQRRGIGFALFTFLVTLSTALGPLLVGIVSDVAGSLRGALALTALPCIPGALVLLRARATVERDGVVVAVQPSIATEP